jgi:hypothetical protein
VFETGASTKMMRLLELRLRNVLLQEPKVIGAGTCLILLCTVFVILILKLLINVERKARRGSF